MGYTSAHHSTCKGSTRQWGERERGTINVWRNNGYKFLKFAETYSIRSGVHWTPMIINTKTSMPRCIKVKILKIKDRRSWKQQEKNMYKETQIRRLTANLWEIMEAWMYSDDILKMLKQNRLSTKNLIASKTATGPWILLARSKSFHCSVNEIL